MNFLIVLVISSVTGVTFLMTSLYLCYKNRKFFVSRLALFVCVRARAPANFGNFGHHKYYNKFQRRTFLPGRDSRQRKESKENRENSEAAQRERYYATIHKVTHQSADKIPETSEDISPYATFQLSEASTLAQSHPGPANTLLHSFMYHERALQEGCASTPPAVLQHQPNTLQKSSIYYNIVRFCLLFIELVCELEFILISCGLHTIVWKNA